MRLVAEAVGCYDLNQFKVWALAKFGPKWAFHLRKPIIELGGLIEAGATVNQFRMVVRCALDVEKLPEHLRADTMRVLAALG